ncbi:LA_2478/LA_2722/LA_4182 family protein [Leptospira wolffii]|uniref:LA_2478/LA_2722/LA_4182 family protein n=1 Tax=Leptospira wolffii TaxID=409998 RepID=UPI001FD2DC84|nr:hypothetical protein [Leptospira wolffii]
MKRITALMLSASVFLFLATCSKSPEERLLDLAPRFQKAMCAKTIECTKDELEKIPAQYRSMVPQMLQSEDACVTFFQQKFEEQKKLREEKKEKITEEMVNAYEKCVKGLETTTCDPFKGQRGGGGPARIPGCEDLEKFSPSK